MKYCVYLTTYSGNKLPPFYIGSTTVEKIYTGYRGSVRSKEYSKIWKEEQRKYPELFKVRIISKHNNRKEALEKELKLQRNVDAPNNTMYVNKSFAAPNGFFGVSHKSQWKGKRGSECPWFGNKITEEQRQKYREGKIGEKNPSASKYQVFNSNNELQFECIGNLIENSIKNGIDPKDAYYIKKSLSTGPIAFKKKSVTGPKPKFDPKYEGWYAIKLLMKKHQTVFGTHQKNCKHIHHPSTLDRRLLKDGEEMPEGYVYGYPKKSHK